MKKKNPKRMEEENKTWLRFLYPAILGCHLKKKKTIKVTHLRKR